MNQIQEDIRRGSYGRAYLLYGEEDYLKRYYRNELRRALIPPGGEINLNVFQGSGIDQQEIIDQAGTAPFFAEHRLIIVEGSGLFKKGGTQLADFLPGSPQETVLLFVEDEVDARGKLYKTVKKLGVILELRHLREEELTRWALKRFQKAGKKITGSAMSLLLENAGNDMQNLYNEMEKLIAYTGEREGIIVDDIRAVTAVQTENRIFEMIDAIAQRQQTKALLLYRDLLALKEPPVRILALISRQFSQLLQVKELREQGFDQGTIIQKTQLRDFVVRKSLRQGEMFTLAQIRNVLERCVWADEAVKTGRMKDQTAVELVLLSASSAQTGRA